MKEGVSLPFHLAEPPAIMQRVMNQMGCVCLTISQSRWKNSEKKKISMERLL